MAVSGCYSPMRPSVSRCLFIGAAFATTLWTSAGGMMTAATLVDRQEADVVLALDRDGRRPVLGLASLASDSDDPELAAAGAALRDVLWDDLDFEQEYALVDRARGAAVPTRRDGIDSGTWTALGADHVLAGSLTGSGASLTLELRRFTLVPGGGPPVVSFGARYANCTRRNVRACAHFIADDVHRQTRALQGVARTRLAFTSDRDTRAMAGRPSGQAKEIYVSDYDGANAARVTTNGHITTHPAWAPDGGHLAFTSWVAGFPDVYVAALTSPGQATRPAAAKADDQSWTPAWSPDGTRLAFASFRTGNLDVWVVNRDGSGLVNLTNHPADDGTPTWSPDGTKIAFTSDRTGVNQLYVMSATGAGVQVLVTQHVDRPTWSPLGFIAFTVRTASGRDIGLYDFAKPGVRMLTDGIGANQSPSVSPTGRHIAFETTRWGRTQIALIDRAGGRIRRVTTEGNNESPSWSPLTP